MSVIVKGMEMPENCAECKLKTWTNTDPYCFVIQSKLEWNKYSSGSWVGIDTRCPLLPLPEKHGRLIDADNFEVYVQYEWEKNEVSNGDWISFREWLKDQATIVEAEGDE